MKNRLVALIALVALAVPTICFATPPRMGPYVSGFVGGAFPSNTDVNSDFKGITDRVQFDPGINIGATGGFDFGFLRLEGELSYKHGEISRVSEIGGYTYGDIDGSIGVLAFMGNVFVDMHNPGPITPYFGGGAGFASLHQTDTFGTAFGSGTRTELYRSDDDTVFAYQAGAGLEIALNRILSLDIGYRYFRTTKATFNKDTLDENQLRFESHNAAIGMRVKF